MNLNDFNYKLLDVDVEILETKNQFKSVIQEKCLE